MKSGLDYFPLNVDLDEKFELIEAEFGLTGFAVVVKLLQRIYGGQGYYCEWTDEVALLFARKIGAGAGVVSEIVEASIRRGIFDRTLYEKYAVLTSRGIQKRYFEAVSRRKSVEVKERYLLIPHASKKSDVDILGENADIFEENDDISEQSKEEKRKEKERKVEERKGERARGEKSFAEFVRLTPQEHEELVRRFGEADTARLIEILDNYKGSTGRKYKSDYRAILSWCVDRLREEKRPLAGRQSPAGQNCRRASDPPESEHSFDVDELEKWAFEVTYGEDDDEAAGD